jgi:hypothetical protein
MKIIDRIVSRREVVKTVTQALRGVQQLLPVIPDYTFISNGTSVSPENSKRYMRHSSVKNKL